MFKENIQKTLLAKEDCLNDIEGQTETKKQLKSALLMDRHVIIVGQPGIGKTTLAKNVARLLPEADAAEGCIYHCDPSKPICPDCIGKKGLKSIKIKGSQRFVRIQGSPDLTVEDLLGDIDPIKALKFGPLSLEAFTPGKIFKANRGILFFDELNRCPEKLLNSLLQVLSENKATIGSYDVDIPTEFIFIGTMNPEDTSTEKLSDVFLDRFDVIYMGYPETIEIEKDIVRVKGKRLEVEFPDDMLNMLVHFVRLLRENKNVEKKPSVRASLGLYERAQSNAMLNAKKKVGFNDIEDAVISVLSHRIGLKPSVKYLKSPLEFVQEEWKKFTDMYEEAKEREGHSP